MGTQRHSFRLTPAEREVLDSFCERRGVSTSSALRILVLNGPKAISRSEGSSPGCRPLAEKGFALGTITGIVLEYVRQTTILDDCRNAFARYASRNGIDNPGGLAPRRYEELPDEIRTRIALIGGAIDSVLDCALDLASRPFPDPSCKTARGGATCTVSARIGQDHLALLDSKRRSFRLSRSAYIRSTIPLLDAICDRSPLDGEPGRSPSSQPLACIPVTRFDDMLEGFVACRAALEFASQYVGGEMNSFATRHYEIHVEWMEALQGRLDAVLDAYDPLLASLGVAAAEAGERTCA